MIFMFKMFKSQAGRGSDFSPRIVIIFAVVLLSSCWGGFRLLTMSFDDIQNSNPAVVESGAVAVGAADSTTAANDDVSIGISALRDVNAPFIDRLSGRSYSCDVPPRLVAVRNEAEIISTGGNTFDLVLGSTIWHCFYWD